MRSDKAERPDKASPSVSFVAAAEPVEPERKEPSARFLALLFVAFVVVALLNRVFQKLMTLPMYNYPFFLNLLTTFAYVPICFAYILPVQLLSNFITADQTRIPKHKFAVMGALDCVASVMQLFAVNYITNASMIVLLQQSSIPISMAISVVVLGARYVREQYVGAAIVCVGIACCLLVKLGARRRRRPDLTTMESDVMFLTNKSDAPVRNESGQAVYASKI